MRFLVIALAVLILSGCAHTGSRLESPKYHRNANAIFADGYPAPSVHLPEDYKYSHQVNAENYQSLAFVAEDGRYLELGYADEIANPKYFNESANGAKEDVAGNDVYTVFSRDLYDDVVSSPSEVAEPPNECAFSAVITIIDRETWARMAVVYAESQHCVSAVSFTEEDKSRLKSTAYKHLGFQ